jgi:hypothetical protein
MAREIHRYRLAAVAVMACVCADTWAANEPAAVKRPGAASAATAAPAPSMPSKPVLQQGSGIPGAVAPGYTQVIGPPDKLTVSGSAGVFSCTAPLTATLRTAGGATVQGAAIAFTVGGFYAGSAATDGNGVANLNFVLPPNLPIGANQLAASTVADHQTIAGSANFDAVKSVISLALEVDDPDNHAVTSASKIIEEERQVTFHGTLKPQSCVQGSLSGEAVSFSVNGKQVGTSNTDSTGRATLAWTIPKGTVATDLVSAEFDGGAHFLPATGANSVSYQIKHKPKLPPTVINAQGISVTGVF